MDGLLKGWFKLLLCSERVLSSSAADARRKGDEEIGGGGEKYDGLKGAKSSLFTSLWVGNLGIAVLILLVGR